MKIFLPFPTRFITQGFGENGNALYKKQGLKGHTSVDFDVPYGTPVPCVHDNSYCYSVMNKDNKDPGKYRAVFTLVEEGEYVYEISYGHASDIFAVPGKTYNTGDILMNVGNTGPVFKGGKEVTVEARKKGSKEGAHLHGPQIRLCKKVPKVSFGKFCLTDANGVFKKDGFVYEVVDMGNGYNGCIAPEFLKDVATKPSEEQKKSLLLTLLIQYRDLLLKRK